MNPIRPSLRRSLIASFVFFCVAALGGFWMLRRTTIEERLSPNWKVIRVETEGLVLADGRTVPLPGIPSVPRDSRILRDITQRGVEVGPNGRVVGLMRVWHWCGTDLVRKHIARVDIAHVLMYFGYGNVPQTAEPSRSRKPDQAFPGYGWDVSDYIQFRSFESALTSE